MTSAAVQGGKFDTSRELLRRASESLACGVSSPFRAKAPVPLYFRDARGARLWDVDGNEYIDYALAWGPLILGHCHPAMVEAMTRQAQRPHLYGAQHDLEYAVSEAVQKYVPCAQRVAFCSSGSEAVQLAFRLARAHTGRNTVLKFEGHYHGWLDSVLVSYHSELGLMGSPESPNAVLSSRGQVANTVDNLRVAPWNNAELLERVFEQHGSEIAAVITEPVLCNSGCIPPEAGYLDLLRRLCTRHGALLIFDEVITGFRIALGGAQQHFGIMPDIATFGKALAGGLPLSAIAGRRDVFDLLSGPVAYGGTFNGNPVSLAGAQAALGALAADNAAALDRARRSGEELMAAIAGKARQYEIPLVITGFGAAFSLHFRTAPAPRDYRDGLADDAATLRRFLLQALDEGLYLLPDGRFYVSAVHTEADIRETADAVGRAFAAMKAAPTAA